MEEKTFTITVRERDGYPLVRTSKDDTGVESISFTVTGKSIGASDGYHTFDELYEHRIALYIALCRQIWEAQTNQQWHKPARVWRSKLHSDGTSIEGWFVLGIDRYAGEQITYHLPDSRWDETGFAVTLAQAPKFDGHTSGDVVERLARLK